MQYKEASFYHTQDFETIFGYTWMIYKRHFKWLFLFSFIGVLLIQGIMYAFFSDTVAQMYSIAENPQGNIGPVMKGLGLMMAVFFVIYTLLYLILYSFILGRELTPERSMGSVLGESVRKHYLPYLLLMFMVFGLLFLGTVAGLILFVIGALFTGLFVGTVLFPSTPLFLVEERTPSQVIPRCFSLVLKDFWHVFGFVALFYIIIILFSLIFSAISMAPYAGELVHNIFGIAQNVQEGASGTVQSMQNPVYIVLNSLFNALILPLTPIFSILVYFHLKSLEDQRD